MRQITNVIIHESDSYWGTAEDIRRWHTDPPPKGRGWRVPGYHHVILNPFPSYDSWRHEKPDATADGKLQHLVPLDDDQWLEPDEIANHAFGYNQFSVGICCISRYGLYTWKQIETLQDLCWNILLNSDWNLHPNSFIGHYETTTGAAQGKTCPGFNMQHLRDYLLDRIKLTRINP